MSVQVHKNVFTRHHTKRTPAIPRGMHTAALLLPHSSAAASPRPQAQGHRSKRRPPALSTRRQSTRTELRCSLDAKRARRSKPREGLPPLGAKGAPLTTRRPRSESQSRRACTRSPPWRRRRATPARTRAPPPAPSMGRPPPPLRVRACRPQRSQPRCGAVMGASTALGAHSGNGVRRRPTWSRSQRGARVQGRGAGVQGCSAHRARPRAAARARSAARSAARSRRGRPAAPRPPPTRRVAAAAALQQQRAPSWIWGRVDESCCEATVQPDPHLRRRTTRRHGVVDLLHVHVRGPGGAGGRGRVGGGPGEVHRQPHVGLPRDAPSRLTPGPWRGAVVQRSLHRCSKRLRCSMF